MTIQTTIRPKNMQKRHVSFDSDVVPPTSEAQSLGNTAKLPSNDVNTAKTTKHTIGVYRLLNGAKKVLTKYNVLSARKKNPHRTRICHSFKQAGKDRVTLSLSENPQESKARLTDVQTCGSWCSCPVCFESLAIEKSKEITKLIAYADSVGLIPVMVAFTAKHSKEMKLEYTDSRLSEAMSLFLGGADWKNFRADFGITDYVMNRDTTYSFKNGWHPHRHGLFLIDPKQVTVTDDNRDMRQELSDRWIKCLEAKGLTATDEHGLHVSDHKNASGEYLAKLGMTADRSSNLSLEMTSPNTKNSMNIWDILRFASMGLVQYEQLFVEYVEYMSGKVWIRWSKGLKAKVDAFEHDVQSAADSANKMVRWLSIGDYWYDVVRAVDDGYARLIECASFTRDAEQVGQLLSDMRRELYLSGKWFHKSACEFVELNDPDKLVIHEDWYYDTS